MSIQVQTWPECDIAARRCSGTSDHQVQSDVVHQPSAIWHLVGLVGLFFNTKAGTLWQSEFAIEHGHFIDDLS